MLKQGYQSIAFRFLLRGPTDSEEAFGEILAELEAIPLFAPTHFGVNESKRHLYDRSAAFTAASGTREKRIIFWNKHIERASAMLLYALPEDPVVLSFGLKPTVLEREVECLTSYRALVERLRPRFAQVVPIASGAELESSAPRALVEEYNRTASFGMSAAQVRRLGPGSMFTHSYVDREFGESIEVALPELDARPAEFGGWWIGGSARPLAPGHIDELEANVRNLRVLGRHGLLGYARPSGCKYAPSWTPPSSWTAKDPRIERAIWGRNE